MNRATRVALAVLLITGAASCSDTDTQARTETVKRWTESTLPNAPDETNELQALKHELQSYVFLFETAADSLTTDCMANSGFDYRVDRTDEAHVDVSPENFTPDGVIGYPSLGPTLRLISESRDRVATSSEAEEQPVGFRGSLLWRRFHARSRNW